MEPQKNPQTVSNVAQAGKAPLDCFDALPMPHLTVAAWDVDIKGGKCPMMISISFILPSGYVKIAIETCHLVRGFGH